MTKAQVIFLLYLSLNAIFGRFFLVKVARNFEKEKGVDEYASENDVVIDDEGNLYSKCITDVQQINMDIGASSSASKKTK